MPKQGILSSTKTMGVVFRLGITIYFCFRFLLRLAMQQKFLINDKGTSALYL